MRQPRFKTPKFLGLPNAMNQNFRRLADILADAESESDRHCAAEFGMRGIGETRRDRSRSTGCFPLVPWIRWLKCTEKSHKGETELRESGEGLECCGCQKRNGLDGVSSSVAAAEGQASGLDFKDASFNLGVGCGLLYFAAASRNELSKMAELRCQMEMLLQNVKEELRRKDDLFKLLQPITGIASSSVDVQGAPNSSAFLVQPDSETHAVSHSQTSTANQSLISDWTQGDRCLDGMDELEEEFEAEFERLQFHLDSENSHKHQQRQMIKSARDTSSVISDLTSGGEVIDPPVQCAELNQGVPPIELERKLHELLESRQQERIKELEAALECAKQEIQDKEIEVSWWKDTVKLISPHVPASIRGRLTRPDDQMSR